MEKIKCSKCGYEWETKSELMFVTCPNCQLNTRNHTQEVQNENKNKAMVE